MRFTLVTSLLIALAAPFWGLQAKAQDQNESVESYKIETQINGRPVVTWVHLLGRPPLKSETLLVQIKDLKLDDVAFFSEGPSQLDELKAKIESQNDASVAVVQPKKGLLKRLGALWNDKAHTPIREDYQYGIVSTVLDSGTYTAMVFTAPGISFCTASALTAIYGINSYLNNVRNNSLNHLLSSDWNSPRKAVSKAKYYARSVGLTLFVAELLKGIQEQDATHFLSIGAQATVLMNILFSDVGEIATTRSNFEKFQNDKVTLAKMNCYVFLFSNILGGIDLFHPTWMPVITQISGYDFSTSGALLIGYYIARFKYADQMYSAAMALDRTLGKVGRWIKANVTSCSRLLSGRSNDGDEPLAH